MRAKVTIGILIACLSVARADPRRFRGTYRNPALGYSIKVPSGLQGETGDQAGPERGMGVSLASGGSISVFGEPNSLEWKDPAEGIEWDLANEQCNSGRQQDISSARVGTITGAKGKLVCGSQVVETLLAFRTGGGLIYWLTLTTDLGHEHEDEAMFKEFAASFRLIRWQ